MNNSTELANFALMALGLGQIQSIDDAGNAASLCSKWYRHAIRTTLAQGEYASTIRRAELANVGNAMDGWGYRYTIPNGCLKILAVLGSRNDDAAANPWASEAGFIDCDIPGAWLKYVAEPSDVSRLDDLVAEAVGYRLAVLVGPGLGMDSESNALREVERRFTVADGAARSVNKANRASSTKTRLWGAQP